MMAKYSKPLDIIFKVPYLIGILCVRGGGGILERNKTCVLRHIEKYSNKYQNRFTHLAAKHTKKNDLQYIFQTHKYSTIRNKIQRSQ